MAGYLDNYGAGEEERERLIKRALIGLALVLVVGVSAYYFFRNYKEERQIKAFMELLRQKDYKQAYAMWGCTDQKPCRDYTSKSFLDDWGPESKQANVDQWRLGSLKSCSTGIIQEIRAGPGEPIRLYVNSEDLLLSFSPWPTCNPRFKAQ